MSLLDRPILNYVISYFKLTLNHVLIACVTESSVYLFFKFSYNDLLLINLLSLVW